MLFTVAMDVRISTGLDSDEVARLEAAEKARFRELQRAGTWRHIWRVVGRYANVSLFDVASNAELHNHLTSLPLYPFMEITVTALCRHPSSIYDDDR